MQIERVSANIRYSKDLGHGAWKVLELGAEATITPSEDWHQAQADLYAELGNQLKALWSANGNGQKPQDGPDKLEESISERKPTTPTPLPEHYCQEHQTEFKRYSQGQQVWWSHWKPDGKWCREK